MNRLAWFTPLPPVKSGIARYNAELLPLLRRSFEIEAFVDGRPDAVVPPDGMSAFSAFDFPWKNRQRPYDLVVYQLGNAPCHDYMWAYLTRYPGLVVLHDGQLHHARGRMLLQRRYPRKDAYRSEFWFNHPEAPPDVAELGIAGLLGPLTYLWPMLRGVVETSRNVVVHNAWLADSIRECHPDASVDVLEMGVPPPRVRDNARRLIRQRHAIPEDAIVFTALGKVTGEKRIGPILRALASTVDVCPQVHLLVAGETTQELDLSAEVATLGLGARVTVAGYVDDVELGDYLEASDVCLCLRWPTSRETSASWLRCLAAGRPTITTDLVHTVDVATLDPRSWAVLNTTNDGRPVGVSIDILDEDHSLRLAMRRLSRDEALRSTLGAHARALWSARYRLDQMSAAYLGAIGRTLERPSPDLAGRNLPRHLLSTGVELAERLLSEFPMKGSPYARG
jgi:glycosyltransferase involved in cell wall biosynthesis